MRTPRTLNEQTPSGRPGCGGARAQVTGCRAAAAEVVVLLVGCGGGGGGSGCGRVWGWGNNSDGQLGNNSITQQITPVSLAGVHKTFCKIYAKMQHSLAIDKNGKIWAWGANGLGQLPIQPENAVVLTPVRVCNI